MPAAAAAGCLLVGYPYAAMSSARLCGFESQQVGGAYSGEMLQAVCKCCA